jgi:protein-S-isoprenylcysteine O-methyltransferase Ste14
MIIFLYGIFAYLVGLFGLTYFILFLGGWDFLPLHIHSKTPHDNLQAWIINTALMLLFALQHSVMARPTFKQWLTRLIPAATERSTYVLLSGVVMLLMCYYWQPIAGSLWQVDQGLLYTLLVAGYLFGWAFAMTATFLINHFELMGLQQVYLHLKQLPKPEAHFTERWFYRMVRHPLQLGVLMGIWFTPHMSMTHFSLALTMTVYILIGLQFEEKDLAASLGEKYRDYQKRVPMLIPWTKWK